MTWRIIAGAGGLFSTLAAIMLDHWLGDIPAPIAGAGTIFLTAIALFCFIIAVNPEARRRDVWPYVCFAIAGLFAVIGSIGIISLKLRKSPENAAAVVGIQSPSNVREELSSPLPSEQTLSAPSLGPTNKSATPSKGVAPVAAPSPILKPSKQGEGSGSVTVKGDVAGDVAGRDTNNGDTYSNLGTNFGHMGPVNIGAQPRDLLSAKAKGLRDQLDQMPLNKTIEVVSPLGDSEATALAQQIYEYLMQRGCQVPKHGITQAVFSSPAKGLGREDLPDKIRLIIGAR